MRKLGKGAGKGDHSMGRKEAILSETRWWARRYTGLDPRTAGDIR